MKKLEENVNIVSNRYNFLFEYNKKKTNLLPIQINYALPNKQSTISDLITSHCNDFKINYLLNDILSAKPIIEKEVNSYGLSISLAKYLNIIRSLVPENENFESLYQLNEKTKQLNNIIFHTDEKFFQEKIKLINEISKLSNNLNVYFNKQLFNEIECFLNNKNLSLGNFNYYRRQVEYQDWYIQELLTAEDCSLDLETIECKEKVSKLLEKLIKELTEEFLLFKESTKYRIIYKPFYMLINSMTKFFQKTQTKELLSYNIELLHNDIEYKETSRNIVSFIPAGQCFYSEKITLNINHFTTRKRINKYNTNMAFLETLWHEYGHAFDWIRDEKIIKSHNNLSIIKNIKTGRSISDHSTIKKIVKQCNKKYFPLKSKLHIKWKNHIDYMLKHSTTQESISRACSETFAECFSIIMLMFLYDFDINKIQPLVRRKGFLMEFSCFKPMLVFLLKNLKWKFIYNDERYIQKQLIKMRRFIKQLP